MRSQMRLLATVCARLQRVAATFLRLAQAHVRQYASAQTSNNMEASTEIPRLSRAGGYDGSPYSDRRMNDLASSQAEDSGTFPGVDVEEPEVATYLE
ncbi:hypothetical protein AFLA70_25g005591 [Aspergillus flavus AF70]|nr:hypothetical protein AFLA70_25g005591 [Aspergillus flavus AF70]